MWGAAQVVSRGLAGSGPEWARWTPELVCLCPERAASGSGRCPGAGLEQTTVSLTSYGLVTVTDLRQTRRRCPAAHWAHVCEADEPSAPEATVSSRPLPVGAHPSLGSSPLPHFSAGVLVLPTPALLLPAPVVTHRLSPMRPSPPQHPLVRASSASPSPRLPWG